MKNHLDSLLERLDEAAFMRSVLMGSTELKEILKLAEFFEMRDIIKLMIILGGTTITLPRVSKFLKVCKYASMATMLRTGELSWGEVPRVERHAIRKMLRATKEAEEHFKDLTQKLIEEDDHREICQTTQQTHMTPMKSFISQHT